MSHTVPSRIPIGVASYSFPFSCGWAKRDGRPAFAQPIRAADLIALAVEHQLSGIEIPLTGMLPDLSYSSVDQLRESLAAAGLGLVVDTGIVDVTLTFVVAPPVVKPAVREPKF